MNYELSTQLMELDLNDLVIDEPEIEILNSEDTRALPELGASIGIYFCCTVCSTSM